VKTKEVTLKELKGVLKKFDPEEDLHKFRNTAMQ